MTDHLTFANDLRIIHSLDRHELGTAIQNESEWSDFCADPAHFIMRCDENRLATIWTAILSRRPKS